MDVASANSDSSPSPKLMKVEDVADELGISTKTVYRFIAEGYLKPVALGRFLKVSRTALDEFIASGGTLATPRRPRRTSRGR